MDIQQLLIGTFAAINVISFMVMASDKRRAVRGENNGRSPEGFIFFLASAFGGVGVYAGMLVFRHKTKKWYFQIGIPLLIAQNFATLHLLNELIVKL